METETKQEPHTVFRIVHDDKNERIYKCSTNYNTKAEAEHAAAQAKKEASFRWIKEVRDVKEGIEPWKVWYWIGGMLTGARSVDDFKRDWKAGHVNTKCHVSIDNYDSAWMSKFSATEAYVRLALVDASLRDLPDVAALAETVAEKDMDEFVVRKTVFYGKETRDVNRIQADFDKQFS